MKILRELNDSERQGLLARFHGNLHFGLIKGALTKAHCYQVEINKGEFEKLVINSSPKSRHPRPEGHPIIATVLKEIEEDAKFLNVDTGSGYDGLNGAQVKKYLTHLQAGNSEQLGNCFILNIDEVGVPGLNKQGSFYVIDGMHRLVAYGLATKLDDRFFPIRVYHCTDQ